MDQSPTLSPGPTVSPGKTWIDLAACSEEDRTVVEQATGLHVPTLAELSEIETSSRLYVENNALYISLPASPPQLDGQPRTSPLGLVLTPDRLLSVHYVTMPAIVAATARARAAETAGEGSAAIMVILLETIIDRLADVLERTAEELDQVSHQIFHAPAQGQAAPARETAALRATLRTIGTRGEHVAKLRDTLLGLGRAVPFVAANAAPWMPPALKPRMETMRSDIASLGEFANHVATQVSFLLDATLGFISIEQNNIIKVLTVVSVVGVPPTLVASIYGMNFHDIPELSWRYGYAYGISLILASAILPLLWFRRRGWI